MRQPISIYFRSGNKIVWRFINKVKQRVINKNPQAKLKRQNRPSVDSSVLKNAFAAVGLRQGDTLLVHSGISNLGKVVGGSKLVFDLIQDQVGINGNLLFPVFPFNGLMFNYLTSNPVFNVNTAPTKMGALSEYALNLKQGQRSIHPTHSILAMGNDSEFFIEEHHLSSTPFGNQSPFARLVASSGKILLIGVGLNSVTSFHRVEDRLGDRYPVKVYAKTKFLMTCTNAIGREIQVKTLAHDPFISRVRDCNLMRDLFLKQGILKMVEVGQHYIGVLDASLMDLYLEELCIKHSYTIYGKIWG